MIRKLADRIRFRYGSDNLDYFEVYIDDRERLQVRTPQASLAVRPTSSNTIAIEAVDRT